MAVEEILFISLIRATTGALRAVIRANCAEEPGQRNMELGKLGSYLITMGVSSNAATIIALVRPPERIFVYPTYMHVILLVILSFIAVSGFAGITVGMFLVAMNNPEQYRRLAMVVLWASCVAAAFALGILPAVFFSTS